MNNNLIWVDKYRPKNFDDIVGQDFFVKRIKAFIESKNLPHLLFCGAPGCGKTTTALVIARELYGENGLGGNFLELNASDDRGIDVIRVKIKEFAKLKSLVDIPYKIICLDEADSLTKDAQQALRRTMEKYSKTCRFILACNEVSKIIDPIQSRCVIFKFKPLSKEAIINLINKIKKDEKLEIDEKNSDLLYEISKGDVRKLTNIIQAISVVNKKITKELIFEVVDFVNPKEIENMINLAIQGEFFKARDELLKLKIINGYSGIEIIKEIYKRVIEIENIDDKVKVKIVDKIANTEFRLVEGSDEEIQIQSILSYLSLLKK